MTLLCQKTVKLHSYATEEVTGNLLQYQLVYGVAITLYITTQKTLYNHQFFTHMHLLSNQVVGGIMISQV